MSPAEEAVTVSQLIHSSLPGLRGQSTGCSVLLIRQLFFSQLSSLRLLGSCWGQGAEMKYCHGDTATSCPAASGVTGRHGPTGRMTQGETRPTARAPLPPLAPKKARKRDGGLMLELDLQKLLATWRGL